MGGFYSTRVYMGGLYSGHSIYGWLLQRNTWVASTGIYMGDYYRGIHERFL